MPYLKKHTLIVYRLPPVTNVAIAVSRRGETVDTEGGNGRHGGNSGWWGIRGVAMSPKHRTGPDAYVKVFRHA